MNVLYAMALNCFLPENGYCHAFARVFKVWKCLTYLAPHNMH